MEAKEREREKRTRDALTMCATPCRMLYASSKDAIVKSFHGIVDQFQATCRGDLVEEDVMIKAGHVKD